MKITDFVKESEIAEDDLPKPTNLVPRVLLTDLPIDKRLTSNLNSMGYKGLLNHQLQAFGLFYNHPIPEDVSDRRIIHEKIDEGVIQRHSDHVILSWKTSAGKTVMAFLFIDKQLRTRRGGKALYCVPFKALAEEVYEKLTKTFKGIWKIGISTGDYTSFSTEDFKKHHIIVVTYHKLNSLLRNDDNVSFRRSISCVACDELHMLESFPVMEDVIIQLKETRIPMILLSATTGSASDREEVRRWISKDAVLCHSDFRPVQLKKGIFVHCKEPFVRYVDGSENKMEFLSDNAYVNASVNFINRDMPTLMFRQSRSNTESTALSVSRCLRKNGLHKTRINKSSSGRKGKKLMKCMPYQCAFHHSGMERKLKNAVEDAYRKRKIRFISSTTGLSTGVNLPASVGIVEYMRYDGNKGRMSPIPKNECLQCMGRIGRPQYDSQGTSLLLLNAEKKERKQIERMIEELTEEYFIGPPDPIKSEFYKKKTLSMAVLGAVAGKYVNDEEELNGYIRGSLSYVQKPRKTMINLDDVLYEMITSEYPLIEISDGRFTATKIGKIVNKLYIHPKSASVLIEASKTLPPDASELAIAFWACLTPDFRTFYVPHRLKKDWYDAIEYRLEEVHIDADDITQDHLRALMTAMVLVGNEKVPYGWIRETNEETIAKTWQIQVGDLQNIVGWQGSADWIMNAFSIVAKYSGNYEVAEKCKDLGVRFRYGIKKELIPLVKIRGVGREYARKLYNNGYKTPLQVANANPRALANLIVGGKKMGLKTAEKIVFSATFCK